MASVCTDDMREELQHYKTFRHDDSQLPYVSSVLEHVKAIISLRIPLDKDLTFPLAPTWNSPPYYRSLGRRLAFTLAIWPSICTVVPFFANATFTS